MLAKKSKLGFILAMESFEPEQNLSASSYERDVKKMHELGRKLGVYATTGVLSLAVIVEGGDVEPGNISTLIPRFFGIAGAGMAMFGAYYTRKDFVTIRNVVNHRRQMLRAEEEPEVLENQDSE